MSPQRTLIFALVGVSLGLSWYFARQQAGSPLPAAQCLTDADCRSQDRCVIVPKGDGFASAGQCGERCVDDSACLNEDGSKALDHTLIFWGSDVSRGNVHAHDDMPFMLAGGGAGFRMGRFVKWTAQYHNDLLVSILNGFGGSFTTYGEPLFCRGPLSNLT